VTRDGRRQDGAARWLPLLAVFIAGCARERPQGPAANGGQGPSLHLLLRIPGTEPNGELGFRFGSPRDLDGDGIADVAAGARFTDLAFTQMGTVSVWSTAGGRRLAHREGEARDALFGHAVLAGPDLDRDGRPEVVASAPNGQYDGVPRGVVQAFALTGQLFWRTAGEPAESLGWHLALAADQNRDGVEDLFAGAPGNGPRGMAYLLDGRTGAVLRGFASPASEDQFGWYVAEVLDLDGDGSNDLLVGAPSTAVAEAPRAGAAYAISTATGRRLHAWYGQAANAQLGEVVTGLPDLDGDGTAEVAVSATFHPYLTRDDRRVGEVTIYSGATGGELRRFHGAQPGELYGRMIAAAGDVDGDGLGDLAIGAPWSRVDGRPRAGRFEVRSGRSGEVLLQAAGERAEMWLGWHIAAGEDLGPAREKGLVVSAIRSEEDGRIGAGALHVYAVRR
jgi:hypothetical protein